MKSFYSFATSSLALSTAVLASEDVGKWRWSNNGEPDTTTILAANTAGTHTFEWKMLTKTGYEADTGNEYFRIEHQLEANIKATDQVTFEVAFTMKNDPWTNKMEMSDDGVVCKVVQSTQNTLLWDQTSEDIYYKCNNAYNCYHQAIAPVEQLFEKGSDDSTGANWTNPLLDDDEDAPYCTAPTDASSPYACTKIKCITQRLMVTGDDFDFEFLPDSSNDEMYIFPGRALLGINELDCSTKCTYLPNNLYSPNDAALEKITIKVRKGASTLLTGLFGAATAIALLAF